MFTEISDGDLFDPAHKFDAIGHGVNLEGVMGSGIAVIFRKMDQAMYQGYRTACLESTLGAGEMYPWWSERNQQWIYNLATQIRQGPNASYVLIAMSAYFMFDHARRNGVRTIGIPTIGCGIGGLEWPRVRYIYKTIFDSIDDITLTVVHKKG